MSTTLIQGRRADGEVYRVLRYTRLALKAWMIEHRLASVGYRASVSHALQRLRKAGAIHFVPGMGWLPVDRKLPYGLAVGSSE